MCGIVGYVGQEQAAPILLDGLSRLEYRGYDSAGVAVYSQRDQSLSVYKSKGRLQVLSDMLQGGAAVEGAIGVGHTRWGYPRRTVRRQQPPPGQPQRPHRCGAQRHY